ncbi:MAG: hypothetical protein IT336_12350 [Thermomicrobiales bacterium]|nr:hypothetical protein [Thermomicrobiales bacterium]
MDDELIGQMRDVTGERIETCDLCGRPIVQAAVVPLEPNEQVKVCESCHQRLEADELPVALDEDADEPAPAGI